MPETTIVCPYCKEQLVTEDDVQGVSIDCPGCGKSFAVVATSMHAETPMPPSVPVQPTVVVNLPDGGAAEIRHKSNVILAGWICFGIAVFLMIVMFIIPIYSALFIASLVLSIIAIVKSQKGGIPLLIASLVVPPILGLFMFLVILGGCAAAVDSEMTKQGIQLQKRPPTILAPQSQHAPDRRPVGK